MAGNLTLSQIAQRNLSIMDIEVSHRPQQTAFAGTRWPGKTDEFPRPYLEIDVPQRADGNGLQAKRRGIGHVGWLPG